MCVIPGAYEFGLLALSVVLRTDGEFLNVSCECGGSCEHGEG